MHTEWSAECGADDPVLVVPWNHPSDPAGASAFVDLRAQPETIYEIAEAEAHPALMQALRALNASRSPVFTAKCDAWEMDAEEIAQLRLELMLDAGEEFGESPVHDSGSIFLCGFASYIDLLCRDRALFASFARQEHLVRRVVRLATPLEHPHAMLSCVLRPALVSLHSPARQGYAISVYVRGLGASSLKASRAWAAALNDVVALLRRNEVFR